MDKDSYPINLKKFNGDLGENFDEFVEKFTLLGNAKSWDNEKRNVMFKPEPSEMAKQSPNFTMNYANFFVVH